MESLTAFIESCRIVSPEAVKEDDMEGHRLNLDTAISNIRTLTYLKCLHRMMTEDDYVLEDDEHFKRLQSFLTELGRSSNKRPRVDVESAGRLIKGSI